MRILHSYRTASSHYKTCRTCEANQNPEWGSWLRSLDGGLELVGGLADCLLNQVVPADGCCGDVRACDQARGETVTAAVADDVVLGGVQLGLDRVLHDCLSSRGLNIAHVFSASKTETTC